MKLYAIEIEWIRGEKAGERETVTRFAENAIQAREVLWFEKHSLSEYYLDWSYRVLNIYEEAG